MNTKAKFALGFTVLFGAGWGGAYAQVQTQSPIFGTVLEYPTSGCDGAVLIVPLPGQQLLPKSGFISSSAASFYGQAAARHVQWLTSMQCTSTGITHVLVPAQENATAGAINSGYTSHNWSGYQISNTAQYAQAGWTIPTVVQPNPGYSSAYYSSTWAGIGGGFNAGSGPLIQSGSTQDLAGSTGTYYFWWEVVGGPTDTGGEKKVSNSQLTAHPGDVAGSVSLWTPDPNPNDPGMGDVTLGVCDFTTGGPCANLAIDPGKYLTPTPGNSVEWIVEAPSNVFPLPLADFGNVTFVNACWGPVYTGPGGTCDTITQGVSPAVINMTQYIFNQYQLVAGPGNLNSQDTGFTDTYNQPERGN